MLRDGVNQGANGLHDAEELLICDQTKKKKNIALLNSAVLNKVVIK